MKLFFAGVETKKFLRVLKKNKIKNFLSSAFYLNYSRVPEIDDEELLIDSGGFTARKTGVIICVKQYADFLNKFKVKVAFNLDTMDIDETLKNQIYLENHTNTYIIPIYHKSDYIERKSLLDTFIKQGYEYIALGGVVGGNFSNTQKDAFFDYVFSKTRDKIKVHGLGITTVETMRKYPFYSVDSTSWLSPIRWGRSVNNKSLAKRKNKVFGIEKKLENESLDFIEVEKKITKLWEARGIVWEDFKYGV